jgi:hypothetical protein
MAGQILLDLLRSMGTQPVPDDEKRSLEVSTEMTQEDNRVWSLNRVLEMALQNAS